MQIDFNRDPTPINRRLSNSRRTMSQIFDGISRREKADGKERPSRSINNLHRNTLLMVGVLLLFGMVGSTLLAAKELYRWEIEIVNASVVGATGPSALAVEYLDQIQAKNVTEGLIVSPGIFSAKLFDDFGAVLSSSSREQQEVTKTIKLMQIIWGAETLSLKTPIHVNSNSTAVLETEMQLGAATRGLIGYSLMLITLQGAAIVTVVWASIFYSTTRPMVAGLKSLMSWVKDVSREDTAKLPSRSELHFDELYQQGKFVQEMMHHLIEQKHDLALSIRQLREKDILNKRSFAIIDKMLTFSNKGAIHASLEGEVTSFSGDAAIMEIFKTVPLSKMTLGMDMAVATVESLTGVQRVIHKKNLVQGNTVHEHVWFDFDVELIDGRIAQLTGIGLGELGYALIISDVTEERAFATELFQRQKLKSLGALASGVAHDMNNILAIILGSLELEVAASKDDGESENLDMAIGAVEQGTAIVSRLLAYSHKSVADVRPVDAARLLHDLGLFVRGKIGSEIIVKSVSEFEAIHVKIDRMRMLTALLNIAINAGDAIGESGEIGLRLRAASAGDDLPKGASNTEDFVVFEITDTGPGIPEAIQSKILDPFYTTKGINQGTGIGLTMAYNVALEFDGRLSFRSEPGELTRFMIALPIEKSVMLPTTTDVHSTTISRQETPPRILIVDDEESLTKITCRYLRERGFSVQFANSIKDSKQRLTEHEFDVVVTDLHLGDGKGVEVAAFVDERGLDVPVILISGNMAYGGLGPNESLFARTLEKPISLGKLEQAVVDVMLKAVVAE